jgi:hypothetical protein
MIDELSAPNAACLFLHLSSNGTLFKGDCGNNSNFSGDYKIKVV